VLRPFIDVLVDYVLEGNVIAYFIFHNRNYIRIVHQSIQSIVALSHVVDLVGCSIDLALYPRVSAGAAALVLENGARDVLIALQAPIQLAVDYERSAE
jgi:hypothetical protein